MMVEEFVGEPPPKFTPSVAATTSVPLGPAFTSTTAGEPLGLVNWYTPSEEKDESNVTAEFVDDGAPATHGAELPVMLKVMR